MQKVTRQPANPGALANWPLSHYCLLCGLKIRDSYH